MSSSTDASAAQLQRPSLLRMLSRSGRGSSVAASDAANGNVLLRDLPTPSFVINRHAFAGNCRRVVELAQERQLKLRPHIKTHKTLEGLNLQASSVVTGFVASTLPEVKLLVNYYTRRTACNTGSGSILYGMPISETKLPALWALQERLVQWQIQWQQYQSQGNSHTAAAAAEPTKIVLLMDHKEQIEMVKRLVQEKEQEQTEVQFAVMVKLDTGYHRAGVPCNQQGVELVDDIVKAPFLDFIGVYSHCGHAYDEEDPQALEKIAQTDMDLIQSFLQQLEDHWKDSKTQQQEFGNPKGFTISVGSTPSLGHHYNPTSTNDNNSQKNTWWTGFFQRYPTAVLEMHPGNYTLYDRQQLYTKACPNVDAIAGRVLTRVIGHYNDEHRPDTIMMDAGATALTKEPTPQGGMAAIASKNDTIVYKMSQEVSMARGESLLQDCPLGSLLTLLPNHSCLAAACFEKYYVIDDPTCQFAPDTPIVEEWEPVKGW